MDTANKLSNLKPLDEYIKDLNSRNVQFAEIIPNLQRTAYNVSSYDDLYKKLIEESYYICSELARGKGQFTQQRTRNAPSESEKEDLSKNINRALIFQSNENINNLNKNENNLMSPSPIIKPTDENKSYFYSTTNRFNNTEIKEKNIDMSFMKNTKKKDNNFNNNMPINNTSQNNFPINNNLTQNNKTFPGEDLLFLINNLREIEKIIEKEDPIKKIDNFENKILLKLIKLEEIQNSDINILGDKKEIEKNIDDLNILYKQFEDRFEKLDQYLEIIRNTSTKNNTDNNYVEREGPNKNMDTNEINNYIYTSDNEERTNDKSNNFNSNTINEQSMYNNTRSTNINKSTPRDFSQRINNLFANSQIREASELWRTFNYERFEGSSIERSYEMLTYITKLKDKEIDILNRKVSNFEEKLKDMKRKDNDIVELFAEMETYKNKYKCSNMKNEENEKKVMKMNNLSNENNLLYKENIKLKTLIQQEKYLSNRNYQIN